MAREVETRPLSRLLGAWTALAKAAGTEEITIQADDLRRMTRRALDLEQELRELRLERLAGEA